MKTRRFKVLMFVLAQVVFARYLTADGGGHRHASAPLPLSQIEGTITAASATSITVHDSHGNDVVLTLTSTTLIRKGDETIAAADLNAGDQVHVAALTQNNSTTAVLVIVQMPSDEREIEGTITAASTTSITVHDSHGNDVVVALTSTTIIRRGDQTLNAGDLAVGDQVHVQAKVASGTNTAFEVIVQQPEDHLEVEGTITAASATSITVHDSHGDDVVLAITASTVIRKGDQNLAPTDLHVGDQVHVHAQVQNNADTALVIIVQQPVDLLEVEGTITAASATSITVHDSHGADVMLTLTDSTVIRKGDQTIAATGLKVGDHVHVMAVVQNSVNTAVLVIVQGSDDGSGSGSGGTVATANGTVTATAGSTLTVHTENAGDVTVNTDSSTIVRKQGTVIAVADIHVGDGVNCLGTKVSDHTILAKQIEVRGDGSGHH